MKKIKIGFFTNTSGFGGAEVYLQTLIRELSQQNFEIILFCNKQFNLEELDCALCLSQVVYVNDPDGDHTNSQDILPRDRPYFFTKTVLGFILRRLWSALIPFSLKLFVGYGKEVQRLKRLFQQYPLDVLHSNEVSPCFEAAIVGAHQAKVPCIIATSHASRSYVVPGSLSLSTKLPIHHPLPRRQL